MLPGTGTYTTREQHQMPYYIGPNLPRMRPRGWNWSVGTWYP